jgi:hypothetical protein
VRVHRAHSYDAVERVRAELGCIPPHWREQARPWQFIILPTDLRPSWIGLTLRSDDELARAAAYHRNTAVGDRTFDTMGAWTASNEHDYWVRDTPHIYLRHDALTSVVHETGHALAHAWHAPVEDFFRPDAAFHWYMATNAQEFFACALDAFVTPERDDVRWNRADLAKRVPDLYAYLRAQLAR